MQRRRERKINQVAEDAKVRFKEALKSQNVGGRIRKRAQGLSARRRARNKVRKAE